MSEEYLVRQAAPTLAGLKTGNLFPCNYEDYEDLKREICALNRLLCKKGLRLIPLRRTSAQALLYLYRPARLRADLSAPEAAAILRREGYGDCREEHCLHELMRRLQRFEEFPHEIGLFLSYPPEDVRGFIEHKGKGSKCGGCWKVYGDERRARELFRKYKACTASYCARKAAGAPVDELAVAG